MAPAMPIIHDVRAQARRRARGPSRMNVMKPSPTRAMSPLKYSQRERAANGVGRGDPALVDVGAAPGAWPTPKLYAPAARWPSTFDTVRQLTVYTPLAR